MAKVTDEKLERLRVRKEQLEAKLKRLQHQQRYQNRKDETRRKIITGASIGAAVRDGVVSSKLLAYVLNRYVTKKNEREFMGLEPREEGRKEPAQPSSEQEQFGQGSVRVVFEESDEE